MKWTKMMVDVNKVDIKQLQNAIEELEKIAVVNKNTYVIEYDETNHTQMESIRKILDKYLLKFE